MEKKENKNDVFSGVLGLVALGGFIFFNFGLYISMSPYGGGYTWIMMILANLFGVLAWGAVMAFLSFLGAFGAIIGLIGTIGGLFYFGFLLMSSG